MSPNRSERLCGSFENDRVVFHGSSPYENISIVGYIFYATAKDGSSTGGYIEQVAPSNIAWQRSRGGQTEGFQYDTPWNPGWN